MHRLNSLYSVLRFRLASCLILLIGLLIPAAVGLLLYSVCVNDRWLMVVALILTLATVTAIILQWALSTRARCPLCFTRAISNNRCVRHRSAKRLFGSYRLRLACTVLFRNQFRCPYCGESTMVRARSRRGYQ